ncbi:hypothetical protein G7092_08355 [Mucilaginibacter sp. HC2]|uniref:hypothetical protein n=1 Tax=Mucilaginibacter inviolabilis TaxID=2714892 RepID=UPI001409A887|nr:hypothetical protein [Mucilaginibacter inviolabilis]NHA03803.1 hypothetical protein [Mucilaginibacter inviolabilis]
MVDFRGDVKVEQDNNSIVYKIKNTGLAPAYASLFVCGGKGVEKLLKNVIARYESISILYKAAL